MIGNQLQRELKYWQVLRRRKQYQFFRALLVGLLAGGIAVLFEKALHIIEVGRDHLLLSLGPHWYKWLIIPAVCAVAGGVAGWMTRKYAPEAAGSGIPHIKAVLLNLRGLRERVLPVKFLGGLLAIGSGFSLGREGPTVQMGALAGKIVGEKLNVSKRYHNQLIASGAGAGLAAAFNAPLAGFVFVIEELQRELSPITYGTALIAAVIGDVMTRTFTGQMPSFHVHGYEAPSLALLPAFVFLGALCGVIGTFFNRGILAAARVPAILKPMPVWRRAALVGVCVGIAAILIPAAIGGGHLTAETLLQGRLGALGVDHGHLGRLIGYLTVLLIVKFVLTVICYGSGVPGGIFAPLLVIGAVTGVLTGEASSYLFPGAIKASAAFGVLGMAAMFASVVRSPLTGIVLILEMTGNYEQLFALIVTAAVSYFVADHLGTKPVYEALLDVDLTEKGFDVGTPDTEPVMLTIVVEPHSRMDGVQLKDLPIPKGCLVVTVERASRSILARGNTTLRAGDHLSILSNSPESTCEVRSLSDAEG